MTSSQARHWLISSSAYWLFGQPSSFIASQLLYPVELFTLWNSTKWTYEGGFHWGALAHPGGDSTGASFYCRY